MMHITQGVLLLLLSASLFAQAEKTTSEKLEERYFGTLDGWVARGGAVGEVQGTVVETCGKW